VRKIIKSEYDSGEFLQWRQIPRDPTVRWGEAVTINTAYHQNANNNRTACT
jgi:hypothetical protein